MEPVLHSLANKSGDEKDSAARNTPRITDGDFKLLVSIENTILDSESVVAILDTANEVPPLQLRSLFPSRAG
jgi:hypothetical protein